MAPRLEPADDEGWYEWHEPPAGSARIFVRIEEAADGRHLLRGVRVDGPVSADLLRSIPVGRIEAAANALLHPGASPSTSRSRRSARIPNGLRANAVQGYPDTFYDAVATAYRHLVTASSSPIGDLAVANDVPVTTAQRWVREARRRGKLPPGRPGKAG